MVRLYFSIDLVYDVSPPGGDFVFNIHAAHTAQQTVVSESLVVSQPVLLELKADPVSRNRCLRLHAEAGLLQVSYSASVDIQHQLIAPADLAEVPVRHLPDAVLPYLYPSRYCQSDRLQRLTAREFGFLPAGYGRAQAICNWVQQRVQFLSNSSNASTSALDTLVDQAGVCRDFAHLMIALCRSANLPARFATGIDFGADPSLGPTDFHAYVEVYLSHRWYIFDPSGTAIPMGFIRIATGRDAADVAFATMFGAIRSNAPVIHIRAVAPDQGQLVTPERVALAVSTDAC